MAALTSDVSKMTTWAWLHRHAWRCEGSSKFQSESSRVDKSLQMKTALRMLEMLSRHRHAAEPLAIIEQEAAPAQR